MSTFLPQDTAPTSDLKTVKTKLKIKQIDEKKRLSASEWNCFYLLPPQELLKSSKLNQQKKAQLNLILQQLKKTLTKETQPEAIAILNPAWQQLSPVATIPLEKQFTTGTSLKRQQVKEFDNYMDVCHVKAKEPAKLMTASLVQAYLVFLEINKTWPLYANEVKLLKLGIQSYADLLARVFNLPVPKTKDKSESNNSTTPYPVDDQMNPLQVWQRSHWIFLVFCQALIICLKRFVDACQSDNPDLAKIELQTAADLMWASGATMKLAGSFSRQIYESEVRPTMTPGHPQSLIQSDPLTGLMMWEHDYLVNVIWKKQLSPILKDLPNYLQAEHAEFVRAYQQGLSGGHKSICAKFGGGEMAALTASNLPGNLAVATLEKFEQNRLKLLDRQGRVSGKCPFH